MSMTSAGYSSTPLWKKLGFKPGMKVMVLNAPSQYQNLFSDSPNDWLFVKKDAEAIHLFITENKQLGEIEKLSKLMPPVLMLWVSWPKKRRRSPKA
jgi:hypothetical protein